MQIAGGVPDFNIDLLHGPMAPMAYLLDFSGFPLGQVMNVKLDGRNLPETLPVVDSFARPAPRADLVAWPVGWRTVNRRRRSFTFRIDLPSCMSILAGGTALGHE